MDDTAEVEKQLREALPHRAAPDGFTAGVMTRLASQRKAEADTKLTIQADRGMHSFRHRNLPRTVPVSAWWSAAAAALLFTVAGGSALHVRHQREAERAAAAEAQVDEALQLTNHALNQVTVNVGRSRAGQLTQLLMEAPQ